MDRISFDIYCAIFGSGRVTLSTSYTMAQVSALSASLSDRGPGVIVSFNGLLSSKANKSKGWLGTGKGSLRFGRNWQTMVFE